VRIGLIPSYSEQEGVLLEGVAPGSPAEQAGLKAGDRIVAVMGQRIRNIEELTSLYDKMEPGQACGVHHCARGQGTQAAGDARCAVGGARRDTARRVPTTLPKPKNSPWRTPNLVIFTGLIVKNL
jgi:predicted metalloprotease with PDZ domain